MKRLVYVSVAAQPFSVDDLAGLLAQSRAANARTGITGILIYKDGAFLQVLEGESDDVEQTYARITADRRHKDVKKIIDEAIDTRDFPDWSMGFENLAESDVKGLEGYANVFGDEPPGKSFFDDLEHLRRFLMLFHPVNRSQTAH